MYIWADKYWATLNHLVWCISIIHIFPWTICLYQFNLEYTINSPVHILNRGVFTVVLTCISLTLSAGISKQTPCNKQNKRQTTGITNVLFDNIYFSVYILRIKCWRHIKHTLPSTGIFQTAIFISRQHRKIWQFSIASIHCDPEFKNTYATNTVFNSYMSHIFVCLHTSLPLRKVIPRTCCSKFSPSCSLMLFQA